MHAGGRVALQEVAGSSSLNHMTLSKPAPSTMSMCERMIRTGCSPTSGALMGNSSTTSTTRRRRSEFAVVLVENEVLESIEGEGRAVLAAYKGVSMHQAFAMLPNDMC